MYGKGIAVVAITRHGVETGLKTKEALTKAGLSATVYAPEKYRQEGVALLKVKFSEFVKDNYASLDALVGVMATGIIIRAIAPFLGSKLTDPAVVGVDAAGRFVVSLLSGHYGGANELARIIAQGIGGTAVITTASDATGKLSVDELARKLHLEILNPESLVAVNAAIVNEDRIVVVLTGDALVPLEMLDCYEVKKAENARQALNLISSYDAGVMISEKPLPPDALRIDKTVKPFTVLKTKRLVVGLGARKDSSVESIINAVQEALAQAHVSIAIVDCFATVDIKRGSPAMIKAVEQLGKPLEFFSVEALRSVNYGNLSPDSKLVQEKIGVGGVCERVAILKAGKRAELILKKTKLNGVTVAIATVE